MAQATRPTEQAGKVAQTAPAKNDTSWLGDNVDPFSLDSITSSKGFNPQKVIVYGIPGIGKSTFASTWPSPIMLRTEDGAGALDVPTFPKVARTTEEITTALRSLHTGNHDFKTLIIDSLDWTEPLVWREVCEAEGKQNIEDFGFGKGYVKVDDRWRLMQRQLDALRSYKKMHIVCIAHAVAAVFDPPDSDPYQKYSLKLHKRAAALWTEWAEQVLFLNYNVQVQSSGKDTMKKAKAHGSGERIIYTQERPAFMAKSRWPLPESIFIGNDDTWSEFHKALNEASNGGYNYAV